MMMGVDLFKEHF